MFIKTGVIGVKRKPDFMLTMVHFGSLFGGDGVCQLPLHIACKTLDEVASKKRAEYQQANGILAEIQQ
ncbi:MAG: hypothetical protein ACSLEN_01685 [Candidatus Malihini olakiniferum]